MLPPKTTTKDRFECYLHSLGAPRSIISVKINLVRNTPKIHKTRANTHTHPESSASSNSQWKSFQFNPVKASHKARARGLNKLKSVRPSTPGGDVQKVTWGGAPRDDWMVAPRRNIPAIMELRGVAESNNKSEVRREGGGKRIIDY